MDRSSQPSPGYRPPLAPGQSYPPLGYSDRGAPLFTYDDRERELAGPAPVVAPEPPMVEPAPPEPSPNPPRHLALGLAAVVIGVLCLALGFKVLGTSGDEPSTRADPPAVQPTDDPYLQGLPEEPQPTVPRDPGAGPPVRSGGATVVYEVESGPATILYVDDTSVKIGRTAGGAWKQTVQGSQNALLRVSVILSSAEPASCLITVDGKVVDQKSSADSHTSGMLTCRYEG